MTALGTITHCVLGRCTTNRATCIIIYIYMLSLGGQSSAPTAHWVTSFITSRPVCVYSCSQLRELWFNDLFMHMYIVCSVYTCNSKSDRLTGLRSLTVRSTTEESGTGTRNAIPVSFLVVRVDNRNSVMRTLFTGTQINSPAHLIYKTGQPITKSLTQELMN